MSLQVVAFQAMMQLMAENFPGVFSGYELSVVESHQRNKADTSGTAKAVVQSFSKMGLDFKEVGWCIWMVLQRLAQVAERADSNGLKLQGSRQLFESCKMQSKYGICMNRKLCIVLGNGSGLYVGNPRCTL
jgi:hypothetical protein